MKRSVLLLVGAMLAPYSYSAQDNAVSLSVSGLNTVLDNGLLKVAFGDDGSAVSMVTGGKNIVTNLSGAVRDPSKTRSAYLDYYINDAHAKGVKDFVPERVEVLRNDRDMAHVAYIDDRDGLLRLEYHLIMRRGVSGLYSYVVAENSGTQDVKVSELRNVYRFDPARLDHLYNGDRQGKPLLYSQLEASPKVQDETWRLPDGSIYSKYDFAGYMRAAPFWGVFGNGVGAWLIHGNREYFSGDALKQDLLVHQDAIILNYMTGSHFGTPDMVAPPGWKKFYGPWLLYINQGDTGHMLADAQRQALTETVSWPYKWVNDSRYARERTQVSGRVASQQPVTVVLSSSLDEPFDVQTRGYSYQATTDAQGNFALPHVRPGNYHLAVYANSGTQPGILAEQTLSVSGDKQVLPVIALPKAEPVVWAIGQANRQASEFRFGNEARNTRWQQEVPANLTFDIGRSDYQRDWYYAQTKPGKWDIRFALQPEKKTYFLNIALAAASNSGMSEPTMPQLAVAVNGTTLETLTYANDKTIYRGALQSGRYHIARIPVSSRFLKNGNNTITLQLKGGSVMYDVVTLSEE
ncbi:polysaccharide lyase family protein [Pectobacterium brasiliense]|uniref:polysaccharide lyase family protein n=1 Tax=Pectobacterium brasiliense TaxID=180957 RepID=UPI001968F791|nr:rhamnogalacturonate lyase [Pectobacterium brasiliense]